MLENYHTHTPRCGHAAGDEEEYVLAAIAGGLKVLGFSDHTPFIFPNHYHSGIRMAPEELEDYVQTVQQLKKQYAGDLIIRKSLEIEYLPQYAEYYQFLLNTYHPDYLLLGEHFYFNETGDVFNIYDADIG